MKSIEPMINVMLGKDLPPLYELEYSDLKQILSPRDVNSHKGSFGHIALIGGSLNYSGAIRLAALANCSMRAGAGLCTVALPRSLSYLILPDILDATVFPLSDFNGRIEFDELEFAELIKGKSAIAFGMGAGRTKEISKALTFLLENYKGRLVIDADGLYELSHIDSDLLKNTSCQVILTPHPKEFSRLCGESMNDIKLSPIALASDYAKKNNCTVLLKGHETIITNGQMAIINKKGCAGMATAGSGDVLSGILTALLGWGKDYDCEILAAASAYIAGLAGELAQSQSCDISMTASDTAHCVLSIISQIRNAP